MTRRVIEHKEKLVDGFTKKYDVDKLVYFETFKYVNDAIFRETCIKRWKREWKVKRIEEKNKEWKDLLYEIISRQELDELRKIVLQNIEVKTKNGFLLSLE